jgi:hypothetical protein
MNEMPIADLTKIAVTICFALASSALSLSGPHAEDDSTLAKVTLTAVRAWVWLALTSSGAPSVLSMTADVETLANLAGMTLIVARAWNAPPTRVSKLFHPLVYPAVTAAVEIFNAATVWFAMTASVSHV